MIFNIQYIISNILNNINVIDTSTTPTADIINNTTTVDDASLIDNINVVDNMTVVNNVVNIIETPIEILQNYFKNYCKINIDKLKQIVNKFSLSGSIDERKILNELIQKIDAQNKQIGLTEIFNDSLKNFAINTADSNEINLMKFFDVERENNHITKITLINNIDFVKQCEYFENKLIISTFNFKNFFLKFLNVNDKLGNQNKELFTLNRNCLIENFDQLIKIFENQLNQIDSINATNSTEYDLYIINIMLLVNLTKNILLFINYLIESTPIEFLNKNKKQQIEIINESCYLQCELVSDNKIVEIIKEFYEICFCENNLKQNYKDLLKVTEKLSDLYSSKLNYVKEKKDINEFFFFQYKETIRKLIMEMTYGCRTSEQTSEPTSEPTSKPISEQTSEPLEIETICLFLIQSFLLLEQIENDYDSLLCYDCLCMFHLIKENNTILKNRILHGNSYEYFFAKINEIENDVENIKNLQKFVTQFEDLIFAITGNDIKYTSGSIYLSVKLNSEQTHSDLIENYYNSDLIRISKKCIMDILTNEKFSDDTSEELENLIKSESNDVKKNKLESLKSLQSNQTNQTQSL